MVTPPRTQTLALWVPPDLKLTSNRRLHWAARARMARTIRAQARAAARRSLTPVRRPVLLIVTVTYPQAGRHDPANWADWAKHAIDGITDAGIWPDDDASWVRSTAFRAAPQRTRDIIADSRGRASTTRRRWHIVVIVQTPPGSRAAARHQAGQPGMADARRDHPRRRRGGGVA